MSTTFLIIGGLVVVFIIYMVYAYRKMKNVPAVTDSENIKKLNNKNYKLIIRQGTVLVDFWAPWCAPCKMMAPVLNEIAEKENDKVTIGKVNVDQQQELAAKYKIRNIPTMILFHNGKEVTRLVGVKSKQAILKEIEKL